MGGARWNSRDWKGPKPAGPAVLSLPPAPPAAAAPAPRPIVAPKRPAAAKKASTRKRTAEPVTARKRREKGAAQAQAAALAEARQVYYHTGTGVSTLGSVRFFHLSPQQQQQLIDYATRHFQARPC